MEELVSNPSQGPGKNIRVSGRRPTDDNPEWSLDGLTLQADIQNTFWLGQDTASSSLCTLKDSRKCPLFQSPQVHPPTKGKKQSSETTAATSTSASSDLQS